MRKLSLLFGFLIFTFLGFSQEANIAEVKETMKLGHFNALVVELPDANKKVAIRVWKTFIKAYGSKAKKVRRTKEYLSKDVVISGVNQEEKMEVYAKVKEISNGAELLVWFSMGESFVSSDEFPNDFGAAKTLLEEYAHEVAKELVMMELEDAEDDFKKMEKDMNKLKKKNDGYHKDIEKAKAAIAKAESNIEENERLQKEQTEMIEKQTEKVNEIKTKLSEM